LGWYELFREEEHENKMNNEKAKIERARNLRRVIRM
jgi:hypothetical protein